MRGREGERDTEGRGREGELDRQVEGEHGEEDRGRCPTRPGSRRAERGRATEELGSDGGLERGERREGGRERDRHE